MSYIGKNPKVDSVKLEGSATAASGTEEGQLYYNTGTGSISKGLKVFKNSQFVSIDKQLGDADTFHLLKASDISTAEFSAARNSTSTSFLNQRSVPFETTTASGVAGTFSNSSTGDALLTDESADLVFAYKSSGTSDDAQEYFGIPLSVPKAFRGGNIVLTFEYRTGFGTGTTATVDGDFEVAVLDKSTGNGGQTTTTDTSGTAIAAGSNIAVASKTGLAVGQRIRLETGSSTIAAGSPDATVTEAFITSISTSTDHITISESYAPPSTSGGRITSGWLTDVVPGQLPAADSQTNKQGKKFSIQFKTEDDTSDIVLFFQNKNTSSTISRHLFVDNILLSANKFLQASSKGKSESYFIHYQADVWDSTSTTKQFDVSLLESGHDSPAASQSKLVSIGDITGPGTAGTVTAITALEDIILSWTVSGDGTSTGEMQIYNSNEEIIGFQGPVGGSVTFNEATISVNLAKNDFVYALRKNGNTRIGTMTIVAEPRASDVIILESQDEIFTSWQDYTPTTSLTGGTISTQKGKFRRVGDTLEVEILFEWSSIFTGGTAVFSLPSGYSIDTSKIITPLNSEETLLGDVVMNDSGTSEPYYGKVGYNDTTSVKAIYHFTINGNNYVAATDNLGTGQPFSWANGDSILLKFRVPISGFNANFNPLLSMPLVDFGSYENVYSARIASDGTVTSMSSESWISSVADDGTGLYTINFKSGFFSVAPAVIYTMAENNATVVHSAVSTSSVNAIVRNTSLGTVDSAFVIAVQRQGSDYRQPPKPTAAVIKPSVALLKDVKAYNVAGGGSTAGAFNSRELNVIEGESYFVTLSGTGTKGIGGTNVEFTLDPGMYKMTAKVPFVGTNFSSARLYDVTNSQVVKYGSTEYTNVSTDASGGSSVIEVVKTVTSATQYKIQYRVSDGTGGNALGVEQNTDSTAVSVYTTVEIEKLK